MIITKKITLLVAILCSVFIVIGSSGPASAQLFDGAKRDACRGANLSASDGSCDKGQPANKLESTIGNIIDILSVIVGIAAVILIIINGLKFITANGDSNSISSAKNGIIYAIVGLIVVAMAQVIVRFVLTRI